MSDNIKLSNLQIVTLAVSSLGGATKAVDIEDIAVRAYEISPDKFSWRKHPERIDLRIVQYALKDASSERKGNPFLKGSVKRGYVLTTNGLTWVENNQDIRFAELTDKSRNQSKVDKLSIEKARLLTSTAFTKFDSGNIEDIKLTDFQEFARVNDYFPDHVRQKRFAVVENVIQGHSKLENLWHFLFEKFVKAEP
jgi:hypothetical protein